MTDLYSASVKNQRPLNYDLIVFFTISFVIQKGSRPPQDRTMVVACLAEVAQEMGPPISSYVDVSYSCVLDVSCCIFI